MSRRKSKQTSSGFGRLFLGTLVLSIVFSAGLITGQRILLHDSLPPLVSVPEGLPALSSSTRKASTSTPGEDEREPDASPEAVRPDMTFYEQLARPAERIRRKENPAPPPKAQPQAQPQRAPEKPAPVAAEAPAPVEVAPAEVAPVESAPVAEAPVKNNPAEQPRQAAPLPARYTLQIAAHPTIESARGEMERLRKLGHEPHVISAEAPGQGTFYRVRIGKFHSMDEARTFQSDLKQRASLDTFVTPL